MAANPNVAIGIATAALVPAIFGASLPVLATVRGEADDRGHLAAAENYATAVSAAVVLGVAGATRSPEVALIGLTAVVGFSAAYRVARLADPMGAARDPAPR